MATSKSPKLKTKGMMSIDKSKTSLGTKVVLLFIAAALALSFTGGFIGSLFTSAPATSNAGGAVEPTTEAEALALYQPQVDTLQATLKTSPEDRTTLVNLGNTYFDWAISLSGILNDAAGQAKVATYWGLAADAYGKAVAISPESPVEVDYSIALHYSGDTAKALSVVTAVTEKDPTFPMAWFNLGVFNQDAGNDVEAKAAFQKYLDTDTTNQYGNRDAAQQSIDAL